MRRTWVALVAALATFVLVAAGPAARAQEGPRPAERAAGAAATGASTGGRELERTIYVPYKDLEKVFEKDGRGVFLPYEEFMRLWRRSSGDGRDKEPLAAPPVDWAIAAGELDGVIEGEIATFKVALDVQILKKGWTTVPLPFARAAIRDVTHRDPKAVIAPAEGGQGWRLIAEGPRAIRLELTLATPVDSKPGVRSISIGIPPAAVSRLALKLPEKGIKVDVSPNLAATTRDGEGDTTELLAFLGAAPEVRVSWNPRPKEALEGKPLVFVDARTLLRIEEGVARVDATLRWQVLQASVGEIALKLPAGYTLVRLEGKLVRDFTVEGGVAKVRLHQKARERFEVEVGLERALPESFGKIPAPAIEAIGVERDTGTLAIAAAEGLAAKVTSAEGVSRVDPGELEPSDREARPVAAFRYLKHPYKLEVETTRIEPEVDLAAWHLLSIGEEAATLRAVFAFDIQRAGVFGYRMSIPKGWQPLEVGVIGDPRASAQRVKDFRVIDAGETQRLEVDLPGRTLGAHRLEIMLTRRRATRVEPVELPRLAVDGVRRESGIVGVAVAAALEVNTSKSEGLRAVAASDASSQGLVPDRRLGEPDAELRLAFRYARPPYAAAFELKPRRPVVSAEVTKLVTIADDVQKVEAQALFTILYAGIRELRVAVPAEIAEIIEIEGAGIQEKRREAAPTSETGTAAPTPGAVVFRILLQTDTIGSYALRASWKRKLGELTSGGSVDVPLAALRVLDVFSETGWIAVQKGDDLVIEPEASGLEPVDARELPPALRDRGGIFRSYRYLAHPYALACKVVKHEFAPVLDTMIDAERVEAVVTRERIARCEATLEVQNNRRQFLEVRLPDGSELLAVYVDGQIVRPALGERKESALISLPKGRTGGNPIRVTLRYDTPLGPKEALGATGRLEVPAPTFPAGAGTIPVGRARLDLFLPNDFRHLAFDSRMQRRFPERRLLRTMLAWIAPEPYDGLHDAEFARPAGAQGGDGLDVKLVREGRRHTFTSLEAASGASFRYMSPALFYALVGAMFLLGLVGAHRASSELGASAVIPALAAALFAIGAFSGETLGSATDGALMGVLAAGAIAALRHALIDAPRARAAAAASRMAELNASADLSSVRKLEREVEALRAGVLGKSASEAPRAATTSTTGAVVTSVAAPPASAAPAGGALPSKDGSAPAPDAPPAPGGSSPSSEAKP